jgi:hypothetical protein
MAPPPRTCGLQEDIREAVDEVELLRLCPGRDPPFWDVKRAPPRAPIQKTHTKQIHCGER